MVFCTRLCKQSLTECSEWTCSKSCPGTIPKIKMPSYLYKDSYHKDKTVSQQSYLYNGNTIPETPSLYWNEVLVDCVTCYKQTWHWMCTYCLRSNIKKRFHVDTKTDHHSDVIMDAIASQINSLTTIYLTVYSDADSHADQRKHQSSASLAFVRGIHRWPVNSPHKWPVTRKMFPFDDVIMI